MELIISSEALKENQLKMRNRELARIRKSNEAIKRRKMIYTFVTVLVFGFLVINTIQIFTSKPVTTTKTPVGEYTCQGGFIKTCSGSRVVMDYLGV